MPFAVLCQTLFCPRRCFVPDELLGAVQQWVAFERMPCRPDGASYLISTSYLIITRWRQLPDQDWEDIRATQLLRRMQTAGIATLLRRAVPADSMLTGSGRAYGVSTGVSPPAVTLLPGVSAVAVVLEDVSGVLVEVDTSMLDGASGVQPSEKVKATATHRLKTVFTGSGLR